MSEMDTRGLLNGGQTPEEAIIEADRLILEAEAELKIMEKEIAEMEKRAIINEMVDLDNLRAQAEVKRDYIDSLRTDKREAEHKKSKLNK